MPKQKIIYPPEIAGVDEVGRGCLAGPVTVCALRLNSTKLDDVLCDSKTLSPQKRESLYEQIIHIADYEIVSLPREVIDNINILQATLLAMKQALEILNPVGAVIDGNKIPNTHIPCEAIIGGDGLIAAISAASIIAKVTRDRYMIKLSALYPNYGFESHKGYGTAQHLKALAQYGITSEHRLSFAPVAHAFRAE